MSQEHEQPDGATQLDPEALYKAPAAKSVKEILQADTEDESLRKYKAALLGTGADAVVIDASNPKNVLVRSLTLVVDGRADITMDLSGNVQALENNTFVVKEGCAYRLRVDFHVQREIVSGLKYQQRIQKLNVTIHKDDYMVGSFGPKKELQSYLSPVDEAPSGFMHRGTYKVKSLFTDDDGHEWLKWDWTLEIKKDW